MATTPRIWTRLAPDDLFSAEMAQDLADEADWARDRFNAAHRPIRPFPGRHVSMIEPIATFKVDLPVNFNIPNMQALQSTVRFHEGLEDAPTWGMGASPLPGGDDMFWIEFTTARDAPIYGVQVGVGWKHPVQGRSDVLPVVHWNGPKGWIAWPRRIDSATGNLVLGASSPAVEKVSWVTAAVMGVSPWR